MPAQVEATGVQVTRPRPARAKRQDASDAAATSDLVRLVEVEDRIAQRLAAVHLEAERILEDARSLQRSIEERGEREIRAALEARGVVLEGECVRAIEAIAERARLEAGTFDGVQEERIASLAGEILTQVIGARFDDPTERGDRGG